MINLGLYCSERLGVLEKWNVLDLISFALLNCVWRDLVQYLVEFVYAPLFCLERTLARPVDLPRRYLGGISHKSTSTEFLGGIVISIKQTTLKI